MRYRLGGRAGKLLLDTILHTTRFHIDGEARHAELVRKKQPVIYVLWHGRLLPLTFLHRNRSIASLISQSADGEYIARITQHWGYDPVRGSSTRGGSAALRALVRAARGGQSLALTPDGPRGPRQQMKPGALLVAQLTGLPLLPISGSATRAWWFEGWDRFLVPKPFAAVHVAYGPLIHVPRDADEDDLDAKSADVEAELNRLTALVDQRAGQA